MKIVAVHTSETSTNVYFTTRQFIPEDSKLHIRRRENLKSHIVNLYGEATLFVSYWAEYLWPAERVDFSWRMKVNSRLPVLNARYKHTGVGTARSS
jgi:hypothetical protein